MATKQVSTAQICAAEVLTMAGKYVVGSGVQIDGRVYPMFHEGVGKSFIYSNGQDGERIDLVFVVESPRKNEPIARVVREELTDGSIAHNVVCDANEGDRVVIGAENEIGALRIASAINFGAAWMQVEAAA